MISCKFIGDKMDFNINGKYVIEAEMICFYEPF